MLNLFAFYANEKDALTLFAFAVYLNFRVFGWRILDEASARLFSHPTPGMRQFYILGQIASWYIEVGDDLDNPAELLSEAFHLVEKALSEISESDYNIDSLMSGLQLIPYTEEIIKHWEALRVTMEKFAYVNLAKFDYHR